MPKQIPNPVNTMDLPDTQVAFDIQAFDDMIRNVGVSFVHYAAMRCPVGLVSEDDNRRPGHHHLNCVNGFLLSQKGEVTLAFQANSHGVQDIDVGLIDGTTVQVVFPRYYDSPSTSEVEIMPFDRLYLKEESITVPNRETFSCSLTGTDRLKFPAVSVSLLVDSAGKTYYQNDDFTIVDGNIKWVSAGPGIEPTTGQGKICTVRYRYRPYWVVSRLIHEVRVAHAIDGVSGERRVVRMPQSALLQREFFFHSSEVDETVPSQRQETASSKALFGPR